MKYRIDPEDDELPLCYAFDAGTCKWTGPDDEEPDTLVEISGLAFTRSRHSCALEVTLLFAEWRDVNA